MLRAIVIDHEEPALDHLQKLLHENGNVEVVGMYRSPEDALARVQTDHVDVVFLEIQLLGMDGLEVAAHMQKTISAPEIVFVTLHNHFAAEAFELQVADYILKPVVPSRLQKTIERLRIRRNAGTGVVHTITAGNSGFCCFGDFQWIFDLPTKAAVKWRRAKERELLAYLLHNRSQFVSKEKIIEDLWPSTRPEQAKTFLHTCVYNIRQMINKHRCNAQLEYRNNSYRFDMQGIWFDVDVFEALAEEVAPIDAQNINWFVQAMNVYRGDYLEQDEFDWAREKREKLKTKYITLMKRMAEFYRSTNRLHDAADCLRHALQKNPYLDDLNESLLRIYALKGNRHAMIQHFEGFTNLLGEELGIKPLESTVRLFQQLCNGNASEIKIV